MQQMQAVQREVNKTFWRYMFVLLRNVQVPRRNYDSHLVFRDPTQLRAKKRI
jgi:hypothetical protein